MSQIRHGEDALIYFHKHQNGCATGRSEQENGARTVGTPQGRDRGVGLGWCNEVAGSPSDA
jgi:hypothetical protein